MVQTNSRENLWLLALPADVRASIAGHLSPRELTLGDVLFEQGDWLTQVYFVDTGIISSIIPLKDGRTVEACMIGNEGLSGAEAAYVPARSMNRLTVQSTGRARGLDVKIFQQMVASSVAVREALSIYDWTLKAELEQSTACNAVHMSEPRFAKWLLRCHDRTRGDVMNLTQEFLAAMLGTQRTTVNEVAQALQARGAIQYSRGKIIVADRRVLEACACECYSAVMATRDRLTDDELARRLSPPG